MTEKNSSGFHKNGSVILPRLEINIPMPAGAAVPRAPQSQPAPIPQAEPGNPAAQSS